LFDHSERTCLVRRSTVANAIVASFIGVTILYPATPAAAVGGNCSSWAERKVVDWAPDKWRVGAKCSSLQSDSKAKGVGDVDGPDHNTAWFTVLNTSRYSSWGVGGIDRTRVEIARV
jgi:hypothetical protein